MSKTEQLNLRISAELKSKLAQVAEESGMSMSDYIRMALETAIDRRQPDAPDTRSDRHLRRMMYAAATIASIDTGHPLDECLAMVLQVLERQHVTPESLISQPRAEQEDNYLSLQTRIQQEIGISDRGIAFISVLFSTWIGLRSNEHIFELTPLSIATLERLRKELG